MDEKKSSASAHFITDPATLAGDPFAYAGDKARGCFACYDGWVYMGVFAVLGEEVEVIEAVPCRRCQRSYESL